MNFRTYDNWFISQKEELPLNINIYNVLTKVNSLVPENLRLGVDGLYIQNSPEMQQRRINAMYDNGIIYVSPDQKDEKDLIDDIIHELGHVCEDQYGHDIYFDTRLETEFTAKKEALASLLTSVGYQIPDNFIDSMDFDENIDNFLLDEVGYDLVEKLCNGIFINAYSITSIREYWAVAFEKYFLGHYNEVKQNCPVAYEKIEYLLY